MLKITKTSLLYIFLSFSAVAGPATAVKPIQLAAWTPEDSGLLDASNLDKITFCTEIFVNGKKVVGDQLVDKLFQIGDGDDCTTKTGEKSSAYNSDDWSLVGCPNDKQYVKSVSTRIWFQGVDIKTAARIVCCKASYVNIETRYSWKAASKCMDPNS